jgi:hypothetical protein
MNKCLAALAGAIALMAFGSSTAAAGMVMTETESVLSGAMGSMKQTRQRTVMIQGNKQKMTIDDGRAFIVDLDKNKMDIIDPTQKNYVETPFPPPGMMAQAIGGPGLHASQFTKTGKNRTVLGYKCDDYNGAGKFGMGSFTVIYCASTTAPGAADFSKFQKAMLAKLKAAQPGMPDSLPDGIPLAQDTTIALDTVNIPNLPPKTVAKLKKQLADRGPMITKTEVTKVAAQKIDAKEFEVPAGYTPRQALSMGGVPSHAMGAPAGATGVAPAAGAPAPGAAKPAKP